MAHMGNGTSADNVTAAGFHQNNRNIITPWQPRLGSSFPYFSRAFDLYMNKDSLFPAAAAAGPEEVRFASASPMPNVSSTGFLSPSYLRGTVYLQKLEEKHRARVLAEREGQQAAKGPAGVAASAVASSSSRLTSNGTLHLPAVGSKFAGASYRGVAYDVVEKPPVREDGDDGDDAVSPLPSRWDKDDKDGALEVLGDGYEVRHTGRPSADHEASAIRADHYISPSCGVYYFEITVLNKKKDK